MNYKINEKQIRNYLNKNQISKEQLCKKFGGKEKVIERLLDVPLTKPFEFGLYQDELIAIASELGIDVKDLLVEI